MQIIRPNEFEEVRWKNGLGTTKQIAISGDSDPYWRMSLAQVTEDSEFSKFPGLHRILTVVEGEGMELLSDEGALQADFETPVSFSGDTPTSSLLRNGPIVDFNLIYDASCLRADVSLVCNSTSHMLETDFLSAVYVLEGEIRSDLTQSVRQGSLLMSSNEDIPMTLSKSARLLTVKIASR